LTVESKLRSATQGIGDRLVELLLGYERINHRLRIDFPDCAISLTMSSTAGFNDSLFDEDFEDLWHSWRVMWDK
jgi:hypothetical protein